MEIKPKSKPAKSEVQQYSDVASSDDMENDKKNPTPHERADLVVRRLEDFIRKGRTEDGGINFRKWQEMAAVEVADAIRYGNDENLIDELGDTSQAIKDFGPGVLQWERPPFLL